MAIAPDKRRRTRHAVSDNEEEDDTISPMKRVKLERLQERRLTLPEQPVDEEMEEVAAADEPALDGEDDGASSSEEEDEAAANARRMQMFGDDARNIQAYERSRARRRDYGKGSEAGVITSVTVVDFMCHKHVTIDLCTRLNFLVGHNGSGKSAFLTAISIALGSKAAGTGRGTGLKDLIRKGCNQSTITLTLNNSGIEAFRGDVYGPKIVIERMISSNGSSTYKFRGSKEGKIIASKRAELTHMVEHFNITVDSPLTVLTQDAARTFLQNANESSLYEFFCSGTGLKDLTKQYQKLDVSNQMLDNLIAASQQGLIEKQHKLQDLERRMQQSSALEHLQNKANRLTQELAWAYVIDKEKDRDHAQKTVKVNTEKLESIKKNIAQAKDKFAPAKAEAEAMKNEILQYERGQKPLEEGVRKAKKQLQLAQKKLQSELDGIKAVEDRIATKQREVDQLSEKIEQNNQARTEAENPEQARTRDDIAKTETLLARIRADRPIKYEALRLRQEELNAAEAAEDNLQAQVEGLKGQLDAARGRLRNLENQAGNRLSAFGTNLDAVFQEFDRARWVKSRPLGPLGQYVQLVSDQYKDVITNQLGPLMCAFAVQDRTDKATCMQILQRCAHTKGYRPGTGQPGIPAIIQHSGDLFEFDHGKYSRHGKTILSQLRVDDPHTLRLLVVQRHIESNFLAPSAEAANKLLDELHRKDIRNSTVYATGGVQASGTKSALGTTSSDRWKGNQVFSKDVAIDIHAAKAEVHALEDDWNVGREELSKATSVKRSANSALAKARVSATQTDKGEPTCIARLSRLKMSLEERNEDNMLDALMESKTAAEEVVIVAEGQVQGLRSGLADLETDIRTCEEDVQSHERRQEEWIPERDLKRETLHHLLTSVAQLQKQLDHWKSSAARYTLAVEDAEEKLAKTEEHVQSWTKAAEEISPRFEDVRHFSEITVERKAAERSIEEKKKLGQTSARDLAPLQKATKEELERDTEKTAQLEKFSSILHRTVVARQVWWEEIRIHISVLAKTLFIVQLQKRNFEGRLEFDHQKERLYVKVGTALTNTQTGSATQAFKDPKSLSGGERSFSTVALLLSMWEVAGCPIRCLDEWDVFLDHVNRGIAAKMLIDGARHSQGKQFILITPQDMAGIKLDGPDMKVIRLGDPERGQATLDFAPA